MRWEGNLADREVDPVQVAFLLRPAVETPGAVQETRRKKKLEQNVRENKMGTMPVNKLLLNMAVPMIVSMLVQAFITWWTACSWPSSARTP